MGAVETAALAGAAGGAFLDPIGSVVGAVVLGGGTALGYTFGGGEEFIKNNTTDALLKFNGKVK